MGLIANQMLIEALYNMTEKLKRACIKDENKADKKKSDGNGKEQDYESSKRNGF